jgi:hypothetical protein
METIDSTLFKRNSSTRASNALAGCRCWEAKQQQQHHHHHHQQQKNGDAIMQSKKKKKKKKTPREKTARANDITLRSLGNGPRCN